MKYVLTAAEMKACDAYTIRRMGIPSEVLMERAALSVLEEIKKNFANTRKVIVFCGSGNNGGDGFAIARLLMLDGIPADVFWAGRESSLTPETALQKKIFENYGGKYCRKFDPSEYTLIVDALFGIGLSRPVKEEYAEIIAQINGSRLPVAAVDMPSGIHADTGRIMGCAVRADITVSFAFAKIGQILYPGAEYCGKLCVKNIGITDHGLRELQKTQSTCFLYGMDDLNLLPGRAPRSNKGTYGTVLLIAGQKNMAGAAYLAGSGAYRSGCGLVRILSDEENRVILQSTLPEAVFLPWQESGFPEQFPSRTQAIGIGPGLGQGQMAKDYLREVLLKWDGPLVIDADGLNLLSEYPEYLENSPAKIILTPHPGEMSRLTGKSVNEILGNPVETCRSFAADHHVVCVLKDARTIVSNGTDLYLNVSGNNGMSVGGSGDVLTGMICGLLAQDMKPFHAACMGVFLHGCAGDASSKSIGKRSMLAGDILAGISDVLKSAESGSEYGQLQQNLRKD